MFIKKYLLLAGAFLISSSVHAANISLALNGDSVMKPNSGINIGTTKSNTQNIIPPGYTSTSTIEITYGTCPAGYLYRGSIQYPDKIRTVTTYYLGGIYSGQSASPWNDFDSDCTTTQYQSIACPSGYNGLQYQSRLVSTRDGYSLDYGSWNTYSSSCVYTPPPPSQAVFTILARPSGVNCRFTEFKIRANYPDGSIASGITVNWTVLGNGALDTYSTVTNSKGEASAFGIDFHNLQMNVRVSFGISSQDIIGICIGGT